MSDGEHGPHGPFPIESPILRKLCAQDDVCPQCGGELDTGWECLGCGYDARDEAYPPARRERDKAIDKRFPDSAAEQGEAK